MQAKYMPIHIFFLFSFLVIHHHSLPTSHLMDLTPALAVHFLSCIVNESIFVVSIITLSLSLSSIPNEITYTLLAFVTHL